MIEQMSTDKLLFQKLKDIFYVFLTTNYNYNNDKGSYLPWHFAYKNNSIHIKVRIVYGASCSDKRLGMSLNNFLWKGRI